MKKITSEQVQAITKAFYDLNAPVQLYSEVVKMLNNLPSCEDKCEDGKCEDKKEKGQEEKLKDNKENK